VEAGTRHSTLNGAKTGGPWQHFRLPPSLRGARPAGNAAVEVVWQEELSERSNVTPTPVQRCCQDDQANSHNWFNFNALQAGDLGFEPSFPGSTPRRVIVQAGKRDGNLLQRPDSRLESRRGTEKLQGIGARTFRPGLAVLTPTRRASEGRFPDVSAERLVSREQPLAYALG